MKNRLLLVLFATALFISCNKEEKKDYKASFTTATADTLLQDNISIRALAIDNDLAWYAGNNGKYGWVSLNGGKDFSGVIAKDTLLPEFRSLAQTPNGVFILSVGTPALLYKISKDGKRNNLVYTESGEKVFYDCLKFYNDKEGIAMGDAMDGALSVLTTKDGGETWTKQPARNMPKAADGENAFAASNTNIVIKGDKTWIASGGKKSRIYYSEDKGKNWEVFDTPIVQGKEMTGIFGADFYDDKIGFAVGGDYEKAEQNSGNKILTEDGGKTWKLVGEKVGFGYASCVQFVPNSNGNELVTVGKTGVWYSFDRGTTWKKILDDTTLNTFTFKDARTIIAAGQEKIIRVRLK
ncbi:beta propeller repeat protein [Flavobacterium subsaxonicum]|uniref:Oxidoreductase n=1 Tax=Flavobacterium subsaxonicum WB 4.1-42 = DSM 21790 TaxID=1121898 RepID=A0A0A2N2D1_9FLAO|nr:oxidoreductase [Flavobacterium subsaxonicum]KGO94595.1 oxidoreductase [Flavobacterium subsaxonicum WB 4.1-42 = DSM 21790]